MNFPESGGPAQPASQPPAPSKSLRIVSLLPSATEIAAALAPDVILTQAACDVCAVSTAAVATLR